METPVVDFHCHVGSWSSVGMDDDPGRFIETMDAAGVDRACISCVFHGDPRRGNDRVADFVARNPDRFIGAGFVTPAYSDEAVPELERVFDVLGFRYLKVYPDYYGRPVDDPGYTPVFEWADDRGIVVMSHSSLAGSQDTLTNPRRFIGLAGRFPRVRWVLAHSGNTAEGQAQAVEAARSSPNIYLETATSFGRHGTIEYLVEGAGEDRVLFGSDMPLMDARFQVGRIATSRVSDDAKRRVLGLNAMRLLGLDR